ncbi:MAG: hypothetical protein ABSD59_18845 [Terracidiphilus sp.]
MRWRRPPLQHPLAPAFAHAVESLCTALTPSSKRNYDIVVRSFLVYLGTKYPKITRLEQLRRDPHILGWMAHLRAQNPPLTTTTCIGRLFALRTIFHELVRTRHLAELAHLLLHEDIPRSPHTLPRPLTPEQDQLLLQAFMGRNDLGGNVFLLLRSTGMRIGECVDLSYDCLRSTGKNQWPSMFLSANSRPSAWSPSMPSAVISSNVCASSAPSTRCLSMGGSWHGPEAKLRSWFSSAITCIRSATPSHSLLASSPISSDTLTPRRCFAPASASPS